MPELQAEKQRDLLLPLLLSWISFHVFPLHGTRNCVFVLNSCMFYMIWPLQKISLR